MTEFRKSEDFSMGTLRKICIALHRNLSDIAEFVPDKIVPDYVIEKSLWGNRWIWR